MSTFDSEAAPRFRRVRRAAGILPTLLTLGNLTCGFAAILVATGVVGWHFAGTPPLVGACMLLILGMLCDGLDGSAARWTRSMSKMGEQLDSLADMVSFGVAPATIAFQLVRLDPSLPLLGPELEVRVHKAVFAAAALYVCCAALRLARYNIEDASADAHSGFRGLPSPGAASGVVALALFYHWKELGTDHQSVVRAVALVALVGLGLTMISSLPYPHLVNRIFGGKAKIRRLVPLLVLAGLLIVSPWQVSLPTLALLYILTGPLLWVVGRFRRTPPPPAAV